MDNKYNILAFAGSLREQSYNKSLIRVAQEVSPTNVTIESFDLAPIPLFNEDVEARGLPKSVMQFRNKIIDADALLIAIPEYNNFMSGVLINALNWASRSVDGVQPLNKKPVAIMSASTSGFGGVRAQIQMKALSFPLHLHLLDNFDVTVSKAQDVFDQDGSLIDNALRNKIHQLLLDLINWTIRLRL